MKSLKKCPHTERKSKAFVLVFFVFWALFSGFQAFALAEAPGEVATPLADIQSENAQQAPAHSAAESHDSPHHSPKPQHLFKLHFIHVTNAMISTWIVAGLLVLLALLFGYCYPRRKLSAFTGLIESSVLFMHDFFADIIGVSLIKKCFWFLGSSFFFILMLNWSELIPGVGAIGWGEATKDGFSVHTPLFRGGNADLNNTLALGLLFFAFWTLIALRENGIKGFILHIFGPKGEMKGFFGIVFVIVFIAIGFIEVVSISVRPISLALRLYGNIFAGGVLLDTIMHKFPVLAWLLPIPFYLMEFMVGFIQAIVFTLLSAIFIMLICSHEGGHEENHDPHLEKI